MQSWAPLIVKGRRESDKYEERWLSVPVGNTEPCTAVITLFTAECLMHRSVMTNQPMACDLKLTYSFARLHSRQLKDGGSHLPPSRWKQSQIPLLFFTSFCCTHVSYTLCVCTYVVICKSVCVHVEDWPFMCCPTSQRIKWIGSFTWLRFLSVLKFVKEFCLLRSHQQTQPFSHSYQCKLRHLVVAHWKYTTIASCLELN